jgi:hypothetical protein
MTVILHLGVNVIPYGNEPEKPKRVAKARKGKANKPRKAKEASQPSITTGDVAEILEAEYGILGEFAERYGQQIADAFANSAAGALESVMMGTPVNDPYAGATTEIEESMKLFLDLEEMNGKPGVPTKAALDGVNHRLKIKKGAPRPSFIDTGLYQSSMRAWVD